ncbi:MAG: MCE family protein [Chlamydiia bacterium]|nr:MCE family protein [Chlamydiia bacterium]
MTDKMKNILIGLFIVTAVTIVVAMILFLEPKVGDGKKTLYVRFTNIAGLTAGTRVTFAGKPVGEVIHIREIKDARSTPDEMGRIYFYELVLKTDSNVTVYDTDEIAVRSTGLMGEKSVAILPKAAQKARLITDEVIYANSIDPLENTFHQITKVANRIEGTVVQLDSWFRENSAPLSASIQLFNTTLSQIDRSLAAIESEKIIPTLRTSADLLNENLSLIHSSLSDEELLHKVSALAEQCNTAVRTFNKIGIPLLHNLNQITHDISSGSGTLGKFITQDDFYLHLSSLFSKANTLMNDINHYGVLFQYDKHWQRSRTKRANLLKALDSPKEFRTYFDGEIDAVTTSLGRLAELLERAENSTEKERIAESQYFKKQFADLLRNSQSLTNSIKLYNEGLIEESKP